LIRAIRDTLFVLPGCTMKILNKFLTKNG